MRKKFTKGTSIFLTFVMTFGMVVSVAHAAFGGGPVFVTDPAVKNLQLSDTQLNPGSGTSINFSYQYSNFHESPYTITTYVYRVGQSKNEALKTWVTMNQGVNGNVTISWDGADAHDGDYMFEVLPVMNMSAYTTVYSPHFKVNPYISKPTVTLKPAGSTVLDISKPDAEVDFHFTVNAFFTLLVGKPILVETSIVKIESNGTENKYYSFPDIHNNTSSDVNWDGFFSSKKTAAPEGIYKLKIVAYKDSTNPVPFGLPIYSDPFTVSHTSAPLDPSPFLPLLSNAVVNPSTYNLTSGGALNFSFDYKSLNKANLTARVYKNSDLNNSLKTWTFDNLSGSMVGKTLSWDAPGLNGTGNYTFEVSGTNNGSALTKTTAALTVTNSAVDPIPSPFFLNNLNAAPNPYDPRNGNLTLSYNVSSVSSVDAFIYNSSNTQITSWTGILPVNGSNSFQWAAPHNLQDGIYTFKVVAYGFNWSATKQVNFQVFKNTNPPTTSNCVGFIDVSKNDPNCGTVYTWVKNAGIFTGNADGTFNPGGLLQRDQVAKVTLEAFGKYKPNTEYCQAGDPFIDVTFSSWARQYICLGKKTLVNGQFLLTGYQSGRYAGWFLPGNAVNRSEFLAIVLRNLKESMPSAYTASYSDVQLGEWDSPYAAYAAQHLTSIYPQPNLNRTQYVTRLEAAQVLYALHNQGSL